MKKSASILLAILLCHLFLGTYGMKWGLPDRWNVDEQVANTLRFISLHSPFAVVDIGHPQLYNFLLSIPLGIYLLVLKLVNYPLDVVTKAASVSWMELAAVDPRFATGAYVVARLFSSILGLVSIIITYRIARLIHSQKTALFSAGILALSLALVETSHFVKSTALVLPLVLSVFYLCLKGLYLGNFRKNILWASFFCGLAVAAKLDGAIAIFFIIPSYVSWMRGLKPRDNEHLKFSFICGGFFVLGIILGWPALLTSPLLFFNERIGVGGAPPLDSTLIYVFLNKIYSRFRHIIVMFGLPMAIFVYAGLMDFAACFKRCRYAGIFASMLIPYFIINVVYFTRYPGTQTRLLIFAVPLLSIFAGNALVSLLDNKRISRKLSGWLVTAVFLSTFLYVLRADTAFLKDTRYQATEWIMKNIPKTATIEHDQEVDILFSTKITKTYNVLYFGRNSKSFSGENFYKPKDRVEDQKYMAKLNREGSSADYFIIAAGDDFKKGLSDISQEAKNQFTYLLLQGKVENFRLIKRFHYPESLIFNPRPSYTCPDIHIFERAGQKRAAK